MPLSTTSPDAVRRALAALCAVAFTAALFGCDHTAIPQRAGIEDEKPQDPLTLKLPGYPKQENLVRIDTGPSGSFEYYIDAQSVDVPAPDTIRYTLVAKSTAGATNVTHEAIRCRGRERRVLALGRNDQTWLTARRSDWTVFSRADQSQLHTILAQEYFCPNRQSVHTADEAVRAVRSGGHPDVRR